MDKQKNQTNYSNRRFSIRLLVLSITSLPMVVACVVIVLFTALTMRQGLEAQISETLKGVASGAMAALNCVSTDDLVMKDGDLFKGSVDISQNTELIDKYAKDNDVEITIFYGDKRVVTTIKNAAGERVVGNTARQEVIDNVLGAGQEYYSKALNANGENYYGYYIPIKDKANNVIGIMCAGKEQQTVAHFINTRVTFTTAMAVVITLICIVIAIIVVEHSILRPLYMFSEVAKKMSRGDIDQTINYTTNNEYGDLAEDFSAMISNIGEQAGIAEMVADGDLTAEYKPASEGDVMGKALKKMLRENNKNLSVIRDAASRMATGVNEVASASNALAQGATEQASAIEQITASIEEIATGAKVNADDANAVNELVQNTKNGAIRGNEQMKHMVNAMNDINESSENISKIMKTIDDIAFNTNILALNASVEAARAGVHGKGFAVVADEVRNLATKSAEAAKASEEMIEDSIKKVEIGSKLVIETATALEEILESVESIATKVSSIADASANQANSVSQVNAGITQIADVVQTNSATSEECAAASAELSSLAGQLEHAVGRYKLVSSKSRTSSFDDSFDSGSDDDFVDNESIISLDSDFGKY